MERRPVVRHDRVDLLPVLSEPPVEGEVPRTPAGVCDQGPTTRRTCIDIDTRRPEEAVVARDALLGQSHVMRRPPPLVLS